MDASLNRRIAPETSEKMKNRGQVRWSAYLPFALGILGAILFLWLIVAIIVSVTSIPHSWYLSR